MRMEYTFGVIRLYVHVYIILVAQLSAHILHLYANNIVNVELTQDCYQKHVIISHTRLVCLLCYNVVYFIV